MDGLLSFLIFAGLFYFMMRVGCGSHMAHGHHGHNKQNKRERTVDPVCGMVVEEDKGYGKLHSGMLYRFCSKKCLDEFDRRPEHYLKKTESKTTTEKEHHHEA